MQLHYSSIAEPTRPGPKWQRLFDSYWPAYAAWLASKGVSQTPDVTTARAALAAHMPEMVPTYERLCQLVGADDRAAHFLTGYQPPAYISACSQAVRTGETVQLVRNYDFHPDLSEGTLLLSAWNGKKVIANSDCLSGVVDGMNEDGLAISLTFGGRKVVGKGFGIPFILRYVLEFCSDVPTAVAALTRLPSHMAYNVSVVDKSGAFKTVRLAPDRAPLVTDAAFCTNHQGAIDWPENAQFNRTLERSAFLEELLTQPVSADQLADAFLQPPLYNTRFTESFGTLYTAVYRPGEGTVQLRWPTHTMRQSFTDFREEYKLINFDQPAVATPREEVPVAAAAQWPTEPAAASQWAPQPANGGAATATAWPVASAAAAPTDTLEPAGVPQAEAPAEPVRGRRAPKPESWEAIATYWTNFGKGYWKKWKT